MFSPKLQVIFITLLLSAIGLFMIGYKVNMLGMPLLPDEKRSLFNVGAHITFEAGHQPVLVSMALPLPQDGIRVLSSETASADFGYAVTQTAQGIRAEWSKRDVDGEQHLYYSLLAVMDEKFKGYQPELYDYDDTPETLADLTQPMQNAAKKLLDEVRDHSASDESFAVQLIARFNAKEPSQTIQMLLSIQQMSKFTLLYRLLRFENIRVRKIRGLYLEEGRRNVQLTPMLEVYNGENWQLFDLEKGKINRPENFFIWQHGGISLIDVTGAKNSAIRFSVSEQRVPADELATHASRLEQAAIMDFSLFSLPISEQNAFKHILLVPIGALVVVLLRILVGLRTSGTFMPILIALAFMETSLLTGLIMFILIVGMGLVIRSYLSSLNLLLVARISAVVIVVIAIMSILSVLSYKLGIEEVLTITFFPMIILAWTIERMSILWEEEGAYEVFIQGGGSLVTAVAAFFAMNNPVVAHITFNFPEVLLIVLALIILIGRYNGYRLSELLRFKSMV